MANILRRIFSPLSESSRPTLPVNVSLFNLSNSARCLCSTNQQTTKNGEEGSFSMDEKPKNSEDLVTETQKGEGEDEEGEEEEEEQGVLMNKETGEVGGPRGPEPTRYGDWERRGRCSDF